jgi:hypothetical protein
MGHQAAFKSSKVPRPEHRNGFGEWIFRHYAPCERAIGFHFSYYDSFIHTPIIRRDIREAAVDNDGSYVVYLPSYKDETLIKHFIEIPDVRWKLYSRSCRQAYSILNVKVFPVSFTGFSEAMVKAAGVLCGAGFETPAEAMFLGKKLMVLPMNGQYEQLCNAEALKRMNIPVLSSDLGFWLNELSAWVKMGAAKPMFFPDNTASVLADLFREGQSIITKSYQWPASPGASTNP